MSYLEHNGGTTTIRLTQAGEDVMVVLPSGRVIEITAGFGEDRASFYRGERDRANVQDELRVTMESDNPHEDLVLVTESLLAA